MIGFYFKENYFRQDLQDHLDSRAFGLRYLAAGEKNTQ